MRYIHSLLLGLFLSLPSAVFAHTSVQSEPSIEATLNGFMGKLVIWVFIALLLLIATAMLINKPKELTKRLLFWSMTGAVTLTTLALIASTVYLNTISWSKGPVHWHADIETWICGEKVEFVDPVGRFSNKIGTTTFHEHNDQRLHVEGVIIDLPDVSLGKFFEVIGGELHHTVGIETNTITVPTNDGPITKTDGDMCKNTGEEGTLQTYVYTVNDDKTYSRTTLDRGSDYVMTANSQVPPGDCIIIEFDSDTTPTDHICKSFEVAESIGKIKGAVDGN